MKLTTQISWGCVALLLTTVCPGQAKNPKLAEVNATAFAPSVYVLQTDDHGGKISSKYDGFTHETIVTLDKMRINCRSKKKNFKDACVSFSAALHCPGIQLNYVRYARLQLIFQTKDWDQRHPLAQRQLSVVADGETFRLGQMKLASQSVDTLMTEVLELEMPYAIFTRIALAQSVEMKVGNTEFGLEPKNLDALRDLNNRVKF